jgi:signal transduction histidine kinase/CheY-like chemotaxis protein
MIVRRPFFRIALILTIVLQPFSGFMRLNQGDAVDSMPMRWSVAFLALCLLLVASKKNMQSQWWPYLAQGLMLINAITIGLVIPYLNDFKAHYLFSSAVIFITMSVFFESPKWIWSYLISYTILITSGAWWVGAQDVPPLLILTTFGCASWGFGYVVTARIAREKELHQMALQIHDTQSKMEAVLSHSIQSYFLMDRQGTLVMTDPRTAGLQAHPEAKPLGAGVDFRQMLPPDLRPRFESNFAAALAGESLRSELLSPLDAMDLEVRYSPWKDQQGQIVGVIMTLLDISSAKKAQKEILEARDAAEHAARSKALFLSQMSHELRTPMNAIIGLSEVSQGELSKDSEVYENLSVIRYSAANLLQILNDILDFSKIEAGKLNIEKIPFELAACVEHVLRTLEPLAQDKGIELVVEQAPNLPKVLLGDPTRLIQILMNFCSNAIKFTDKGKVSLRVQGQIQPQALHQVPAQEPTQELGQQGDAVIWHLRFEVQDTGIGIPKDKMSLLFERFSQTDASIARKYGGTGLGLSISKQLAEMQGGRVDVQSTWGIGSVFIVELPYAESTVPVDLPKAMERKNLHGLRILIVDDNKINLMVASKMLQRQGCLCCQSASGAEALQRVQEQEFDLILLDLHMPEMDGRETYDRLRSEALILPQVPVIALTADAFEETRNSLLFQGFAGFVSKPMTEESLSTEITRVLRSS